MGTSSSRRFSGSSRAAVGQEGAPWKRGYVRCPRRGYQSLVNLDTAQLVPTRCGSNGCPVCLPLNALGVVGAVTMTRPENFIRLTMATDEPARLVNGMATVRRWWRRYVGPWQDVYAIEANPAGSGLHLHGWQYGSPVDRGDLERAAEVAGFLGSPYGAPRQLSDQAHLGYFLKDAIYRPTLIMPAHAERFLELNNMLVHGSNAFWRDHDGQRVETMRKAVPLARGGISTGGWVLTTDDPVT